MSAWPHTTWSSGPHSLLRSSGLPSSYGSSSTIRLSCRADSACSSRRACSTHQGRQACPIVQVVEHDPSVSSGQPSLFRSSGSPDPFGSLGLLDFFGSPTPTDLFGSSLAYSCLWARPTSHQARPTLQDRWPCSVRTSHWVKSIWVWI